MNVLSSIDIHNVSGGVANAPVSSPAPNDEFQELIGRLVGKLVERAIDYYFPIPAPVSPVK